MSVKTIPMDESSNKEFAPHPKGVILARCVHVIDLGEMVKEWEGLVKLKPGLQFVFYTGAKKESGEPFLLTTREFTNTMGEKGNLRKFLEAWRGATYTPDQVKKPIDLEKLVGQPCQLTVGHAESKKGRTYATIVSISPILPSVADQVPKLPSPKPAVPQYLLDRVAQYASEAAEYRERIGLNGGQDEPGAADGATEDDDLPF